MEKRALIAYCQVTIIYKQPNKVGQLSKEERIEQNQLVLLNNNRDFWSENEKNKIIKLTFLRTNTKYDPDKTFIKNLNFKIIHTSGLTTYTPD